MDKELKEFVSESIANEVLQNFDKLYKSFDVVVVEDYNKGLISESICKEIIKKCKASQTPIFIDPHLTTPAHFYKDADLLKPNINEVFTLLNISQNSIIDKKINHFTLAKRLQSELNLKEVLLTLGQDGMAILADDQLTKIPTLAKQVYDVTGAGDTVIAVLALAHAVGLTLSLIHI